MFSYNLLDRDVINNDLPLVCLMLFTTGIYQQSYYSDIVSPFVIKMNKRKVGYLYTRSNNTLPFLSMQQSSSVISLLTNVSHRVRTFDTKNGPRRFGDIIGFFK